MTLPLILLATYISGVIAYWFTIHFVYSKAAKLSNLKPEASEVVAMFVPFLNWLVLIIMLFAVFENKITPSKFFRIKE